MPVLGQQFADIPQAARLAIEQILAFAAAIDAARDVHFVRVDRQAAVGVFERERHLAGAQRAARRAAVENDVRHFLAAETSSRSASRAPI